MRSIISTESATRRAAHVCRSITEPGALVERGCIWRPRLRFEDFAAGQLDLETLKSAGRAVFDVTAHPLFQEALARVPAAERHGPLVTDESGRPVSRR